MVFQSAKKQVLVVDSDPLYCSKMVEILEGSGFDVLSLTTAQGVLHTVMSLHIDLVIIAESLIDGDGFDVCDSLKSIRKTGHIPVMILSLDSRKIRKYRHVADDYISRSYDKEELLTRIEAIWRRNSRILFQHQNHLRQQQVVNALRRVLKEGLIQPYFQPVYSLHPFRFFGLEILSRPTGGGILSNAADLFQAALKYNMYYPLEMLCWRKALDIVAGQTRNERVFFNCNPYMIEHSKFNPVRNLFELSRIPIDNVVLEITERSSIAEQDLFYNRLWEYRHQGFRFAVDDLGAGYATLESIAAARPEIVKIDARIVRNLHFDDIKRCIVKSVVNFCKESDIMVVAEGVETSEEMDAVVGLGVDAVQGYHLFRPTPDFNLRQMKDVCVAYN